MAVFPGGVKSFTTKTDGVDDVLAAHVNDIQDEVEAIETALLEPWFDYSATSIISGFAGALTTQLIRLLRDPVKKIVFADVFLAGTSNDTVLSFTVPANCAHAAGTTTSAVCVIMDSGVRAFGTASIAGGGTTVTVFNGLFSPFTNSGNKEVRLKMFWMID